MIRSVIQELYFDNCGQMEKIGMSKRYELLQKEAFGYYDRLSETLSKEQKGLLEKIWEKSAEQEGESNFSCFRAGLKFGLRLAAEVLAESEGEPQER